MKNTSAVLFDLDGTLIDSEFFYFSNWQPILSAEFGLEISYEDWIEFFAGHTLVANVQLLATKWGIQTTQEFMWDATRANYAKSDMTKINLMPFAREILTALKEKGIRLGLVTSSYRTTVDAVLGKHQLLDFFEIFVTRENVSQAKPNPEPYLLASSLLGITPGELIAIEDTSTGCASAKAAGLHCIAVSQHESERAKLTAADRLCYSMDEVLKMLI